MSIYAQCNTVIKLWLPLVSYPAPTSANMADAAEGWVRRLCIIIIYLAVIAQYHVMGTYFPIAMWKPKHSYRDAPSVHSLIAIRRQEDTIHLPFCAVIA